MSRDTIGTRSSSTVRGVWQWFIRETISIVMADAILFLCAESWFWGWATVITLASWGGTTTLAVIPPKPALTVERTRPRKGSMACPTPIMLGQGGRLFSVLLQPHQ
jgi:hypothetical protein